VPEGRIRPIAIHDCVDHDQPAVFEDAVEDADSTDPQPPTAAQVPSELVASIGIGAQQQECFVYLGLATVRKLRELGFSYSFEAYLWQVPGLS